MTWPSDGGGESADPLRGRVALVTGGGRGIGRAVCLALARAGAAVGPLARDAAELTAVAREIRQAGGRAPEEPLAADVRNFEEVDRAVRRFGEQFGPPDILVAAAGVAGFAGVMETSLEEWQLHLDTNPSGVFPAVRAVLPGMLERGRGEIVAISSVAAIKSFRECGAYAASKAGLQGFLGVLREEVRDRGVRVTAIVPGATATVLWGTPPPVPESRMMDPEAVARAVLFAITADRRAMMEEIVLRPTGGDI
jgi:3-oxoacyl-[acyl-carrier protein] reductase